MGFIPNLYQNFSHSFYYLERSALSLIQALHLIYAVRKAVWFHHYIKFAALCLEKPALMVAMIVTLFSNQSLNTVHLNGIVMLLRHLFLLDLLT